MPSRPWAVIAAKSLRRSKTRLGPALGPQARYELARELFERVLSACQSCSGLAGTLVVTDGDDVAALSARRGAKVLRDPIVGTSKLGAIVDAALATLPAFSATHGLVLMADLPRALSRDVSEVLAALGKHDMVVVPDRRQAGTNVLGLRLDRGIVTQFGHADSLDRHLREATRLGIAIDILRNPHLAWDIDTLEDLVGLSPADGILPRHVKALKAAPRTPAPRGRAASVRRQIA